MDENDWNQVLRNCSLLYGWKIDKKANKVVRATTPGKSIFGKQRGSKKSNDYSLQTPR